jgi:hypothetical protein
MKSKLISALPHAIAVLVFVIASSTFFGPLWNGYELRQGDIDNWRGMAKEANDYRLTDKEEALWTNSMFGGMPAYQISVVHGSNVFRYIDEVFRLGLPRPVGTLFLCMIGFYIFALCLRVNPWLSIAGGLAFGLATVNILYLGAGHTGKVHAIAYMAPTLGALILAYRGKVWLGAALFALFLGLNISANHLQMTYYLAFAVGLVAVSESIRLLIEKQWTRVGQSALFLLLAGLIGVLPNLSNLITTYQYGEYTTRGKTELTITAEGEEKSAAEKTGLESSYILQYNLDKGEQWSLYVPNARGGNSAAIGSYKEAMKAVDKQYRENIAQQNAYWGGQLYTGGAFSFGAGVIFLFVLALIFSKDFLRWPFLVLSLLAIALSMNEMTTLNDFFIHHVPLYNKFRDSKMILVLIQVMAPALALLFLQELAETEWSKVKKRNVFIGIGVLVLVAATLRFAPGVMGDFLSKQDKEQFAQMEEEVGQDAGQLAMLDEYKTELIEVRKTIYSEDAGRSLVLVLLVVAVVVLVMMKKIPTLAAGLALAAIFAGDLWTVDLRYLNDDKTKGQMRSYVPVDEKIIPHRPSKADDYIFKLERANVSDFDAKVSALKTAMKQDEYAPVKKDALLDMAAGFSVVNRNTNYRVLSYPNPFSDAGTSYFHKSIGGYHGAKLKRYQELIEFRLQPEMATLVDSLKSGGQITVLSRLNALNMLNAKYIIVNPEMPPLENPYACGNAWFVSSIKSVKNADEEITELANFDPKSTALVDERYKNAFTAPAASDSSARIEMKSYSPRRITYTSNSSVAAPAVFSEIYYPEGWVCRVDGKEVDIVRVNYLLRGVMLPAGEHTVEMSFEPAVFSSTSTYSLVGSVLLMLVLVGAGAKGYVDARKKA